MIFIDRATFEALQIVFEAAPRFARNRVLARFHGFHIDADRAVDCHAVIGRTPRQMRGVGACHERRRWNAARIDAGPAKILALDYGDIHSGAGKTRRYGWTRLWCPEYDGVV